MGEAEVKQFELWLGQLATAEDPLDVWYEHMWAADVDHRAIEGAPDDVGPIIGRDAARAYLAEWYEMFPDLEVVPEGIIDGGPERVIVMWHVTGTAKASGVPTEMRLTMVFTIRAGRIVRSREYMTKDEALAAVAQESHGSTPTD
jgi:ketosteroid isomerase-like protein